MLIQEKQQPLMSEDRIKELGISTQHNPPGCGQTAEFSNVVLLRNNTEKLIDDELAYADTADEKLEPPPPGEWSDNCIKEMGSAILSGKLEIFSGHGVSANNNSEGKEMSLDREKKSKGRNHLNDTETDSQLNPIDEEECQPGSMYCCSVTPVGDTEADTMCQQVGSLTISSPPRNSEETPLHVGFVATKRGFPDAGNQQVSNFYNLLCCSHPRR